MLLFSYLLELIFRLLGLVSTNSSVEVKWFPCAFFVDTAIINPFVGYQWSNGPIPVHLGLLLTEFHKHCTEYTHIHLYYHYFALKCESEPDCKQHRQPFCKKKWEGSECSGLPPSSAICYPHQPWLYNKALLSHMAVRLGLLNSADEGFMILWKVGSNSPSDTASHQRPSVFRHTSIWWDVKVCDLCGMLGVTWGMEWNACTCSCGRYTAYVLENLK